jgi:hypothetical protein
VVTVQRPTNRREKPLTTIGKTCLERTNQEGPPCPPSFESSTALPTKGQMKAPAVVSHSARSMFIRWSILRTMEGRLELRLCSILIPVKKVRTNSARESAFIFGRSTSIFLAISRFSLLLLRVIMSTASDGNIANSRSELTAKDPFCPSMLHGPSLRNRSILFQPKGWAVSSPLNTVARRTAPKLLQPLSSSPDDDPDGGVLCAKMPVLRL